MVPPQTYYNGSLPVEVIVCTRSSNNESKYISCGHISKASSVLMQMVHSFSKYFVVEIRSSILEWFLGVHRGNSFHGNTVGKALSAATVAVAWM
jgi:hypothetical protein